MTAHKIDGAIKFDRVLEQVGEFWFQAQQDTRDVNAWVKKNHFSGKAQEMGFVHQPYPEEK